MVERPKKGNGEFLKGVLVLSMAAIIVKILSAVYRIPFQNIAGDIGFYIYQQVYPFYGVALILSTAGFPLIISKLVAEKKEAGNERELKEVLAASALTLGFIGLFLFFGLFFSADWIAEKMKDPGLAGLLRIIAFSYLIMPLTSVWRGYFHGKNDMVPSAASQLAEQFIRVATILLLTFYLLNTGHSLYGAGKGAVFGSLTGGFAGALMLLVFWFVRKENLHQELTGLRMRNMAKAAKTVLFQGLVFCITSLFLVLLQFVDSWNVFSLLMQGGMGDTDAKAWKGVYDRGQPLLQLGTTIAGSLALSLVPFITGYIKVKNKKALYKKTELAVRVSLMIGTAAAAGLIFLIRPVNRMLFTDEKGSVALAVFSMAIVFASLIMVLAAVVQSLGHPVWTISIIMIGIWVKWMLNEHFVPLFGITGASLSTVLALLVICVLFYTVLHREIGEPLIRWKSLSVILAGNLLMGLSLCVWNGLNLFFFETESRLAASFQALFGVAIGAGAYLLFVLKAGLFNKEELGAVPYAHKLVLFMDRSNRKYGK
ncbi:putative polysaccharide biosynthesis protein [Bacillus massiliglaciei]|uniref:putative polysaccharide biosynthesis protein n=1 Tax=Bacillus massiliglaciei TaxID=1816693 RepID=UPI000A542D8F|nr:polysaccharide biosynthesis protein [Bacillus massiliglaciei]